ncbi:MAG: hypothetical protein IK077_14105 [Thermoguttaceae bacterium]|nr:hypothetical protein [Thermoguttaceae bacterium]
MLVFLLISVAVFLFVWAIREEGIFDPDPYLRVTQEYLSARRRALNERKVVKFSQLPVFPTRVPYCNEMEIWSVRVKDKWEDLADKCCREIRGLTDCVMLMRGDNHIYSDGKNHVLLVIDEVEQSKKELAIAALVMSDERYSTAVSVRHSCWPRSIFGRDGCGFHCTDKEYRRFVNFFGAPTWAHGRQLETNGRRNDLARPYDTVELTPIFSDDTELRANNIATMLKYAVERVIRS